MLLLYYFEKKQNLKFLKILSIKKYFADTTIWNQADDMYVYYIYVFSYTYMFIYTSLSIYVCYHDS